MSKLDYVTIAIVAICILAIVFFVYKMTDLFGDKPTVDSIESVTDPVETEDDAYDMSGSDEESTSGETSGTGEADTDGESTPTSSEEDLEGYDASESEAEDDVAIEDKEIEPSESYGSTGKYMVIAGTFQQKANARRTANRLRRLGYEHANVEVFDRGKYAVVLVDRFTTMSEAERLVNSLKEDGVKSYVKAKK